MIARVQEAYCNMLVKYREELTRPIDEAMEFLKRVEAQLDCIAGGGGSSSSARLSLAGKIDGPTDRSGSPCCSIPPSALAGAARTWHGGGTYGGRVFLYRHNHTY
jgi:hypothetical protein